MCWQRCLYSFCLIVKQLSNPVILYIGNKLAVHGRTPGSIDTLGRLLEEEGYTVRYSSSSLNKISRLVDMLTAIWQKRNEADVVLIDTYSTSAFYFAWLCGMLCTMLRIKYIPILHGGNLPQRFRQSPGKCRQLFGKSFRNITVSPYLQKELRAVGMNSVLIENSIQLQHYIFRHRQVVLPKLLWVRAFHETYNPQMAVLLMKQLAEKYPDARLNMVGPDLDGSMQLCKALAKELKVEDKITFTGKLPKQAWIELAQECDVFINTTNYDNLPVSVIEAMALGMPVVSTNAGGVPYIIEDGVNGLLVEKEDVHAMAIAVQKLLKDALIAAQLSENARKHAEQFDWQIIKLKWQQLLLK